MFRKGSKREKAVEMLKRGATFEELLKGTGLTKNSLLRLLNMLSNMDGVKLIRRKVYVIEQNAPKQH